MMIRVIIPGFGQPRLDEKTRILESNLKLLSATKPANTILDVYLHAYDDSPVPSHIDGVAITCMRSPGIVGDFIKCHANERAIEDCDKVFMCLDDVELMPSFHLSEAITIQERFGLDIFSPCLTTESATFYHYMRSSYGPSCDADGSPLLRITTACEMFCYLMPTQGFMAWCQHLDKENPWLWGMDLLLTHKFGLRVGMLPSMTMMHHFQSLCYDAHPHINPFDRFHAYLKKYGETQVSLSHLPALLTTLRCDAI